MTKNYRNYSIKINAVLNVIKQLCSVVFPLITIPYVTRILRAENLGKVNFSTSVISYFALIAQMGIANYAVREGAKVRNEEEKIRSFSSEIFTLNLITTALAYILLLIFMMFCKPLWNYRNLLLIQSTTIIFTTIGADWINNIFEDFFALTIRTIFMQVVSLILMFIFVHNTSDYIIYAIVVVLAQCGAYLYNAIYIRKYIHFKLAFSRKAFRHLKPCFYLFFNNIAMTVYINSDTTMLGIMVGDVAVAIYYIATKIYTVIKHIINAIIVVAVPRLSEYAEYNRTAYNQLCEQVFNSIITVLFPAVVGLFCCSSLIVKLIAGEEFIGGTAALQILSVSLLFAVMGGYNNLCLVMPNRKDTVLLVATSIAAGTNIVLNFFLIPLWSYNGAAITTVIAEIIVAVITYLGTSRFVKFKLSKRLVISVLLGCGWIGVSCRIIQGTIPNDGIGLLMSVITGIIGYGLILILFKNPIIMEVFTRLSKKKS